jgi:hypothetical protein
MRAVIDHAAPAAGGDPPAMSEGVAEGLDFPCEQIANKKGERNPLLVPLEWNKSIFIAGCASFSHSSRRSME